jgi:hypothetical protein
MSRISGTDNQSPILKLCPTGTFKVGQHVVLTYLATFKHAFYFDENVPDFLD